MRTFWRTLWITAVVAAISRGAAAQNPGEEPDPTGRATMYERVGRLLGAFQSLGSWDEHYGYLMDATDRFYERQGWTSEPHQFSLEVIQSVESVPPWAVQERFDTMMNMLSDRYLLDENQERFLRQKMVETSNGIFRDHGDRIMKYAIEAIQTRAQGEAFTPEKVQRWSELAEPVFLDMRQRMEAAGKELLEKLDPAQREILGRDLIAAKERMGRIEQLGQEWKQGNWSPGDWGMEDDPIQIAAQQRNAPLADPSAVPIGGAAAGPEQVAPGGEATVQRPGRNPAATAGRQPAPEGAATGADDPWVAYVEAFIRKYQLEEEQAQRARLILSDVTTRRDELNQRYAERIKAAKGASPASETLVAKNEHLLRRLFDQMSRRLERLPTSAQRREALPLDLPQVVAPPPTFQRAAPASAPASTSP